MITETIGLRVFFLGYLNVTMFRFYYLFVLETKPHVVALVYENNGQSIIFCFQNYYGIKLKIKQKTKILILVAIIHIWTTTFFFFNFALWEKQMIGYEERQKITLYYYSKVNMIQRKIERNELLFVELISCFFYFF